MPMDPAAPTPPDHAPAPTATIVLRHADVVVTMDAQRREIRDGAVVLRGRAVAWVGATAELPAAYAEAARSGSAEVMDMAGHVVMPGLVNTHHHMYQSCWRRPKTEPLFSLMPT